MPPRISSSQRKSKPGSSTSRVSTLRLDQLDPSPPSSSLPPTKKQKLKPLSYLTRPPVPDLDDALEPKDSSQGRNKRSDKGKGTARNDDVTVTHSIQLGDSMWVDMYEPTSEEDLAVHVRKVQDVRNWFQEAFEGGPSGKLKKYRRILALTGPAGTAKTTTLRVLAKELNIEIVEWKNNIDENHSLDVSWDSWPNDPQDFAVERLSEKFQAFLTRAASCRSIFPAPVLRASFLSSNSSSGSSAAPSQRQIILLEDLPNILHIPTQEAFHAALKAVIDSPLPSVTPIVVIVSDAGLRGESGQEDGNSTWNRKGKEAIDIRSVLPPGMLTSPYVTQIRFNPIAPTLMKRALQTMLTKHFKDMSHKQSGIQPSKEIMDIIVESSNGDIRSAIMTLQFACISNHRGFFSSVGRARIKSKKSSGAMGGRVLLEAVTRREQSLALFHLIGKLLYNKRKGDPPSTSASKKDIQRDNDLDAKLKDPPKLPRHLREHQRRTSRVDVEELYADSPIDSSLLSLYVHQNYAQYCNQVEECGDIMDTLSWVDSSGGEAWYQANPHRFHLISLGTLHSLPSPVTRRNQKSYKPEFFDILNKEKEGQDGVRDTQYWLRQVGNGSPGWTRDNVIMELGSILKSKNRSSHPPPRSHLSFSGLQFQQETHGLAELAEEEPGSQEYMEVEYNTFGSSGRHEQPEDNYGGLSWLEEDDIEET